MMLKRRIQFVIFDVDGTLVDSQNMIVRCLELAAGDMGISVSNSRRQLLSGVGLPMHQAVPKAIPTIDPKAIPEFINTFRVHYDKLKDDVLQLQPLFEGAIAMLQGLKSDGYKLGICTSKIKAGLDGVLDIHNIRHFFDSIKTPDDGPAKPDPFLLNQAIAELGIAADAAVFVGDSTYDVKAGIAANMRTLGVSWGYHSVEELQNAGAHKIVHDITDIIPSVANW